MIQFKVEDGRLKIGDISVSLPLAVREAVALNDTVAVMLDVPARQKLNRNVFLLDERGNTLWQIEESPHGTQQDKPYMNIWLDGKGNLVAGNWNGVDYNVDVSTGRISVRAFSR